MGRGKEIWFVQALPAHVIETRTARCRIGSNWPSLLRLFVFYPLLSKKPEPIIIRQIMFFFYLWIIFMIMQDTYWMHRTSFKHNRRIQKTWPPSDFIVSLRELSSKFRQKWYCVWESWARNFVPEHLHIYVLTEHETTNFGTGAFYVLVRALPNVAAASLWPTHKYICDCCCSNRTSTYGGIPTKSRKHLKCSF